MPRPATPVLIAITLPVLLAVAVAAIAITARVRGVDGTVGIEPPPATGPLAVVPIDAPDAAGPECVAVLAALPAELPANDGPLPPRPLAQPAPDGVRAWVAAPRPVVLRCGLPHPAELTPTSALLEVDGVRWLELDDGNVADPGNNTVVTYVAVDRPVYVVLTIPIDAGTGPLQVVSEAVRAALPAIPVAVR
ncbi:MAG: DUF3515 domain-containing protein [Pseudonocardia sp.]